MKRLNAFHFFAILAFIIFVVAWLTDDILRSVLFLTIFYGNWFAGDIQEINKKLDEVNDK
ncbi:hypothetical protein [Virgibacillus salexigens]|uniref:Uncharacterized protein n=2 Tax=Virgibacillus TaxID=84406 RepID=A0A024QC83_9BACI|nr:MULTISPECIES: hypothetical protein [Virgibacillus]GGJ48635.1 hypothetical protein GCM10007111_08440 [Virgibacillus kapii]CDQ39531.1 hypothetical protein BN990_01836 [Virgibacillus massiliensis]